MVTLLLICFDAKQAAAAAHPAQRMAIVSFQFSIFNFQFLIDCLIGDKIP